MKVRETIRTARKWAPSTLGIAILDALSVLEQRTRRLAQRCNNNDGRIDALFGRIYRLEAARDDQAVANAFAEFRQRIAALERQANERRNCVPVEQPARPFQVGDVVRNRFVGQTTVTRIEADHVVEDTKLWGEWEHGTGVEDFCWAVNCKLVKAVDEPSMTDEPMTVEQLASLLAQGRDLQDKLKPRIERMSGTCADEPSPAPSVWGDVDKDVLLNELTLAAKYLDRDMSASKAHWIREAYEVLKRVPR